MEIQKIIWVRPFSHNPFTKRIRKEYWLFGFSFRRNGRRQKVLEFRYSWNWFVLHQIFIVMDKIIKVVLAVLFLLCLLEMPYGFYQFVRFLGLIGFAILAYEAQHHCRQTEVIIYVGLALLFQPFLKVSLGRQMWNIVDVVVGLGLLVSIFQRTKTENK